MKSVPPKDDSCPVCKSDIVRRASNMNCWACSKPECELAHGPTWNNENVNWNIASKPVEIKQPKNKIK